MDDVAVLTLAILDGRVRAKVHVIPGAVRSMVAKTFPRCCWWLVDAVAQLQCADLLDLQKTLYDALQRPLDARRLQSLKMVGYEWPPVVVAHPSLLHDASTLYLSSAMSFQECINSRCERCQCEGTMCATTTVPRVDRTGRGIATLRRTSTAEPVAFCFACLHVST